ncbi:MAG: hypothetical protein LBF22_10345 [Deltaproteobacteria bacterium]|nr:hypothetical protein [Deltaproteobacteria bacterium]
MNRKKARPIACGEGSLRGRGLFHAESDLKGSVIRLNGSVMRVPCLLEMEEVL